jgi:hypothetical protein
VPGETPESHPRSFRRADTSHAETFSVGFFVHLLKS